MFAGTCVLFVVIFGLQLADGDIGNKEKNYKPLKYPGPVQEDTGSRYVTPIDDIPESCRNQNFCAIKPPDYPQERFNKMFKGRKPLHQPTLIIERVADRLGNPEEMDDCDSEISFKPLYRVRNQRKDWRLVVQAPDESFVQKVRLETCTGVKKPCFNALPQALDIETLCRQKYSTWEFLVLTEANETVREKVDLPSCCVCKYKFKK